ncbi:MAG: MFS transporter [Anaerolineales bacterium]
MNTVIVRRAIRGLGNLVLRPYPIAGTTAQQREGIKYMWYDLLFANMSVAFFAEFLTLYILELGGTTSVIGTMTSASNAMALLGPIVGATLVARSGKRKIWVLIGPGSIGRLTLLLSAITPLFCSGSTAVLIVVVLTCIRNLAGTMSSPPGTSLQGDILPPGIRSRWNSLSMVAANAITVIVVPLTGWLIRVISGVAGYQVALGIATVLGFVATSFYARIPEPESAEGPRQRTPECAKGRSSLAAVFHDQRFMLYCGVMFVWSFGQQLSAPFFTVYMRESLGLSVETIAWLATGTAVVNVGALIGAGRLVNDRTAPKMTAIGMLLVPLMPIAWYLAADAWGVLAAKSYGVIAWALVNVSNLPLILAITPRELRSRYIAVLNVFSATAAIIVPIPAAWIYDQYGFKTNLLLSAAGRGVAGILYLIMYLRGSFRRTFDELPEDQAVARPALSTGARHRA